MTRELEQRDEYSVLIAIPLLVYSGTAIRQNIHNYWA
jgi:hypothetical protein